jgi:hypothetical protein
MLCGGLWFWPAETTQTATTAATTSTTATRARGSGGTVEIPVPPESALDLTASVGDTLVFTGLCPTCSVFETDANGSPLPHAPDAMTGPPRTSPAGLYAYVRNKPGWVEGPASRACACRGKRCDSVVVGDRQLCSVGPEGEPLASLLCEQDALTGALVELGWSELCPNSARCDFDKLGRLLDLAADCGKVLSVGFRAGFSTTPEDVKVDGIEFTSPSDATPEPGSGCGFTGRIGVPMNPSYLAHVRDFLSRASAYLRADGRRYQTIARVEGPFFNWVTIEAQAPRSQIEGCPDNLRTWSRAGYTPESLYAFERSVYETYRDRFPGKAVGHGFIQNGAPRVDGANYVGDGNPRDDPPANTQAVKVLDIGFELLGDRWIEFHKGARDHQDPNRWIVEDGREGRHIGFQTVNHLETTAEVLATLGRIAETTAEVAEVYEGPLWKALHEKPAEVAAVAGKLRARSTSADTWSYVVTKAGDRYFTVSGSRTVHHVAVR